jgi:hypothetical protein
MFIKMGPIKAIRIALAFNNAEKSLDMKSYASSRLYMDKVKMLAGTEYYRPDLFELHLLDALIYNAMGQFDDALMSLTHATHALKSARKVKEIDRTYLINFCENMISEIDDNHPIQKGVTERLDWSGVSRNYRSRYPLTWKRA